VGEEIDIPPEDYVQDERREKQAAQTADDYPGERDGDDYEGKVVGKRSARRSLTSDDAQDGANSSSD